METDEKNIATYREIITQTQAWQGALDAVSKVTGGIKEIWKPNNFTDVIFTGCGSTYYLSLAAAALFQEMTGHNARAVPGGELFMYPDTAYSKDSYTLLVAISRSGTTTETITAVKQFKEKHRGAVIGITNYSNTPLVALGDLAIVIPQGREQSVAQTRSFASMYVAVTALTAVIAKREDYLEVMYTLPVYGEELIRTYEPLAREIGQNMDLDRYFFLGSGPRYGLACEANLKMKEMTLTTSEPFHFMEFRHGPMSLVSESSLIIGLLSDKNRRYEQAVLDDMAQLGGKVFSLGDVDTDVVFKSNLPESIRNVLYLPVPQLLRHWSRLQLHSLQNVM